MPFPATVCVVDDDDAFRAGLVTLLRSAGLTVRAFASAEQLLALSELPAMACLVVDLRMRGMGGLALSRELARRGVAPPTLLMTAWPTLQVRQDAAALGMSAVIEKPAEPELVLAQVERCLRG